MAELHTPSPQNIPANVVTLWPVEDPDYPLGCECADPSLQIEMWGEAQSGGTEAH